MCLDTPLQVMYAGFFLKKTDKFSFEPVDCSVGEGIGRVRISAVYVVS